MRDSDLNDFSSIWAQTMEVYGKTVTPGTIELVFNALAHLGIQEVRNALTAHMRSPDTGQFPPKPGDVIKFARGDSQSRTLQAWAKVERAIRSVGHYRDVAFDDPLIHAVIERMGGWPKLCSADTEQDLVWLRQRFEAQYRAYAVHKPETWPAFLPGVATQQNAQLTQRTRGRLPGRDIALIGDQRTAAKVIKRGRESQANGTQVQRLTDERMTQLLEHFEPAKRGAA